MEADGVVSESHSWMTLTLELFKVIYRYGHILLVLW